jgi:carotenoid cleavage dioxygenase-like enzyme
MNAYDDGEQVVMDVVRHPKMFASEMRGPSEGRPALVRWRMDPSTGRLSETMLDDRSLEFSRFNDARAGQAYRFGYTAGANDTLQGFGAVYKQTSLQAGTRPTTMVRAAIRWSRCSWRVPTQRPRTMAGSWPTSTMRTETRRTS